MKITHENLNAAAILGIGFSSTQLAILGIRGTPKIGWGLRLIGTEISDADYSRLLALGSRSTENGQKTFCPYPLPPDQEKPRQSTAGEALITMQVPAELVETVEGLIRFLDAIRSAGQKRDV